LWPPPSGDAAELLDVDVDQLAGTGAFVAADGFAGGTVGGCQSGQVVSDEYAVGGGGGDAASGGQPHRSDAMFAAQAHYPFLDGVQGAAGLVAGAAGAVLHPGGPVYPVAACPACCGRVADLEAFRGPP
jgi:AICAR transformylase/IMP cyclohydrolase PurH